MCVTVKEGSGITPMRPPMPVCCGSKNGDSQLLVSLSKEGPLVPAVDPTHRRASMALALSGNQSRSSAGTANCAMDRDAMMTSRFPATDPKEKNPKTYTSSLR